MAAEGEFAFLLAVFAVSNDLITPDLYASIVLAVLMSTIIAPFLLRFTIARFNKDMESRLIASSDEQATDSPSKETEQTKPARSIFYCIQTKSKPAWGIQADLVAAISNLRLDIIDHRSWHPPHSNELLVNEVYVSDMVAQASLSMAEEDMEVANRIDAITSTLEAAIQQNGAIVKVQRWFPNIHRGDFTADRLVREAGIAIERSRHRMTISEREEDYIRMEEAEKPASRESLKPPSSGNLKPSSGGSIGGPVASGTRAKRGKAVEHLDERFKGCLEGLIRHDSPHARSLTYDDGVELLNMGHGSDGYYS